MSAFAVDVEHIHVLVKYGMGFGADRDRVCWETDAPENAPGVIVTPFNVAGVRFRRAVNAAADDIGQLLVSANWRSVNYRYSEDELEPIYEYRAPRRSDREPVEILSAIACLRYQACEFPEWGESEAARYLDAIEHLAIGRLPGWSEAAYEIQRDTPTLQEARRSAAIARQEVTR